MGEVVKISEKKHFIRWFLHKYELQNREAEWLLQYLSTNDQLLERVHFIDSFKNLPKTILMSATCVQMTPFKFYKNKNVTSDVEKAFMDIHNHPSEDIFVGLFFKDRAHSPEYASVLEANPHEDRKEPSDRLIALHAELVLEEALSDYQRKSLYRAIDEALDRKDRQAFLQLTAELRKHLHLA